MALLLFGYGVFGVRLAQYRLLWVDEIATFMTASRPEIPLLDMLRSGMAQRNGRDAATVPVSGPPVGECIWRYRSGYPDSPACRSLKPLLAARLQTAGSPAQRFRMLTLRNDPREAIQQNFERNRIRLHPTARMAAPRQGQPG